MSPRSELNSKRAVPFRPLLLAIKLSKYVVNRKWKHHLPGMKISQSAIFYEDTIRWSPSISSSSSSILLGREVDRYFSIKTTDWRISSFCLYNYCQPISEHFWQSASDNEHTRVFRKDVPRVSFSLLGYTRGLAATPDRTYYCRWRMRR